MDPNNRPENGLDDPPEPLRPPGKHHLEDLPRDASRRKPRQAHGAEVVEDDAEKGRPVEALLHGVLVDVNVAKAEGLTGGVVHGDDTGTRLGPGRQGRGEGDTVGGAVAGLEGHSVEVEVLDGGRGCCGARGEAVVVAQIVGEFAGVLGVHVGDDAGFDLCLRGGAAIGCHCSYMCVYLYVDITDVDDL